MPLKITDISHLPRLNKWADDIETRLNRLIVTSEQGRSGVDANRAGAIFKSKGTYQQAVGGGRAHVALDKNNRIASTKHLTAANAAYTPTNNTLLSQSGTSTLINISASTQTFPDGDVNYNSGSVDPGAYGLYYVYVDDATYEGSPALYQATPVNQDITANDGRLYFGQITTTAGGGATGGGGGNGACFTGNTRIVTNHGLLRMEDVRVGDLVATLKGPRPVLAVLVHEYAADMLHMGDEEYVTPRHHLWRGEWVAAETIYTERTFFAGNVYNLTVEDEHNYTLANGEVAHNVVKH